MNVGDTFTIEINGQEKTMKVIDVKENTDGSMSVVSQEEIQ